MLSISLCYQFSKEYIWLLLSFGYCYHSVSVIIVVIRLAFRSVLTVSYSFAYCNYSVIIIISFSLSQSNHIKRHPL
jgi:hypothetical protein